MAAQHDEYQNEQRRAVVRQVKEAADIAEVIGEHVTLRRAGANLLGLCPFHAEKTPSFNVSPAKGVFHCFGCGEGGDLFKFVQLYHRITFPEALRQLAERYRIPMASQALTPQQQEEARHRERLYRVNAVAADLFSEFLNRNPEAAPARKYLESRGIPQQIREEFRLGYAPESWDFLYKHLQREGYDPTLAQEAGLLVARGGEQGSGGGRGRGYYDRFRDRILFPLIDLTGRVAGFGGRILGAGEPKYLNTPETPIYSKGHSLFGLYQHRETLRRSRYCLLVEGNFDLLSLSARGVKEVVAPLGTALTADQLRLLRGYVDEAILFFDGDAAGIKAAVRAVPLFLSEKLSGRVVILPQGEDPDSYAGTHGREGIEELVAQAKPLPEFVFDQLAARHGLGVDGKSRIIAELAPIARALDDQLLLRTRFISHFSERLGISPEQFTLSMGADKSRSSAYGGGTSAPAAESRLGHHPGDGGDKGQNSSNEDLQLSANEEKICAFIFFHGQYLAEFLDAGLDRILVSRASRALLELISHGSTGDSNPETLLDTAPSHLRPLISRLLINGGRMFPEEQRDESARELLCWLRGHGHRKSCELLNSEINSAYQAGDQQRLLELMRQKQELAKES